MIYFYSYSKRSSLNNFGISWTIVVHIHVFSRNRQPETPHSQNWLSYDFSTREVCLLWVEFLVFPACVLTSHLRFLTYEDRSYTKRILLNYYLMSIKRKT